MGFDYSKKILKKKDKPNEKGVKSYIYFAPKSWFDTIKVPLTTTNPGDSVTISDTHTFKTGFGFVEIETTLNSTFTAEQVGELGGKGFAPKLEGFYPGNDKIGSEIFAHLKDDDVMALVPLADGQFIQLGKDGLWTQASASFSAGTNADGKNGWTVTFESYSGTLLYYEGDITKKPDPA